MKTNTEAGAEVSEKSVGGESSSWHRFSKFSREHPYMIGLMFLSVVAGAIAGTLLPLGEFSMTRRIVGGAIAGFYFGLFPLGFRLLM